MTAIRTLTLAAAFSFAAVFAAPAMTVADLAGGKILAAAALNPGFGDELLSGSPTRFDRVGAQAAHEASESYFDYDALITLGALALAGGGLAAMAGVARKSARGRRPAEPVWRESVFRALQADLAQFTDTYRRAA